MKYFFVIVFLVHVLVNAYIFIRGWQAVPAIGLWKAVYVLLFLIGFSSFIIAMLGRNTIPLGFLKVLYAIGTSWLACMLYFTLFFIVTDLIHLFNHYFHFLPDKITGNSRLFHVIQAVSGCVVVLTLLVIGYLKFNHPAVEKYDIRIHKKAGDLKSLRIVAFSDIHLGITVDKKRLSKYVKLINDQKPDVVFIAGDVVDNNALPLNKERMYEELNEIKAPLGTYACLGNHEYLSGIENSLDFYHQTNIHLLIDSATLVNNSFWVIGRDDRSNLNRSHLSKLTAQTDPSQPLFLLDHQPYHLEEAQTNGIDLQVSGHTHNGQLWPLNLIVEKIYEVGYGYKQKGKTTVYTSSGLALWGPPFRIGTQSEIVVFNIQFDK